MLRIIAGVFTTEIFYNILALVASTLSARLLGPGERGILVVALMVASLGTTLSQMGLPHAMTYNLARSKDRNRELSQALRIWLHLLPIIFGIVLLFFLGLACWGGKSITKGLTPSLLASSGVFCVVSILHMGLLQIFSGLQDFKWRNILNVTPYAGIALVLISAWTNGYRVDALLILWVYLIATAVAVLLGTLSLWRRYKPSFTVSLQDDWKQAYVGYGLKYYGAMLAQMLNYRLDILLVNAFLGSAKVGFYSTAVASTELLLFFPSTLNFIFYPKVAAAEENQRDRMTSLTLGASLYLVLICGLLWSVLLPYLIPFLYGEAFSVAVPAALWLIPGMVSLTLVKVICHAVAGVGRPEYSTYITLVGLVGTVIMDIYLIPRFGIVGAAWASAGAYSVSAVAALIFYIRFRRIRVFSLVRDMLVLPFLWLREQGSQKQTDISNRQHAR